MVEMALGSWAIIDPGRWPTPCPKLKTHETLASKYRQMKTEKAYSIEGEKRQDIMYKAFWFLFLLAQKG